MKDNKDKYFKEYLNSLKDIISFPSVLSKSTKNAPFGKDILNCLKYTLKLCKKLGFNTHIDDEGYYGYAEIGQGKEMLAVLCHLDVVPAGDLTNWSSDPFKLEIKDNYLIGRGVEDDKGPSLLCLYALKYLLDKGIILNKRVRFIFGCDEEVLWRCIEKYKAKEELPTYGFAPDGSFPLINGEKGLFQFKIKSKEKIKFKFNGGEALNVVASYASIEFNEDIEKLLIEDNIEYIKEENTIKILGKPAHVQNADEGINANLIMMDILNQLGYSCNLMDLVNAYLDDCHGGSLFKDIKDKISKDLMFNIGIAKFDYDKQEIAIDTRIPLSFDNTIIIERLEPLLSLYNLELEIIDYVPALNVTKDSFIVSKLLQAYREVSNDNKAKPKVVGGATFARLFDNMVAFGARLPHLETTAHQANERVLVDNHKKAFDIYIRAFELLLEK